MSNAAQARRVIVQGAILSSTPDGTKILTISSKTGEMTLEFTADRWARLEESAKWHWGYANGVNK